MSEPLPTGHNGQDASGRFKPGNKLGKGNPLNSRAQKIRAVLLKSLTPTDAKAVAAKLLEMAKGGDLAAIRELLDRTIGKPSQAELLERIESIEQLISERKS